MNLRKIDMLVAEKVMDWQVVDEKYGIVNKLNGEPPTEFSPSIKIIDAWEVVEKFANEGIYFTIHKYKGTGYFATIDFLNGSTEAETVTLAICLSALKARKVDIEDLKQKYLSS